MAMTPSPSNEYKTILNTTASITPPPPHPSTGGGALYSRVLLLDNRQRRACLERDPVTLQQFVGWRVVLRYLALFGLVLVALRFLTSAMLPIIAVTVVSEARALQCVQGSFGLRC